MRYYCYYNSPLGKLYLEEQDRFVTQVSFQDQVESEAINRETALLTKLSAELNEYFQGKRLKFDLPLSPEGTPFQQKVWQALTKIPYGQTVCYQQIASAVGNPKSCRAVGMANNHNPISILIPCHRVIGKNGSLVGYGGGLDKKERLLNLERSVLNA